MKIINNSICHFIVFLLTLLFVFRDLLLYIRTNLIDWRDYPLMIWIMSQHTLKIQHLNFANYFDTNAFFPHKYSLLFSDLLLPQALISLPFLLFSNNIILIFNIVFLLTFILNFVSLYLFWRLLFKDNLIAFLGSMFALFSPFFHLSISHFQMLSFWPFFFSLYFLFSAERRLIYFFLSGLFLTIQFLASVYLAVFLIFSIVTYIVLDFFFLKNIKTSIKSFLAIFLTFLILGGIFIQSYINVQKYYQIDKEISEYINYSASVTDYIFTSSINSFLHQSPLMKSWNSPDKNFSMGKASSAGILFTILAVVSLISFTKRQNKIILGIQFNRLNAFFIALIVLGVIFSLGPRLNFNGNYAHIPLPYNLLLKMGPLIEPIRNPSRWSFIFYIGIIYFALMTIKKIKEKGTYKYLILFIFILFIFEYIPLNLLSEKGNYLNPEYHNLKTTCEKNRKVLLEVPVTHRDATDDVAAGLTYINKVQLASLFHQCNLVNGYSGYDLPDNLALAQTIDGYILNQQTTEFIKELRKKKIDLVKFNVDYFRKEASSSAVDFFNDLKNQPDITRIGQSTFYLTPEIRSE